MTKDFITPEELTHIKWRVAKRIQRKYGGITKGHEDEMREMIANDIKCLENPSLLPIKTPEPMQTHDEEPSQEETVNQQIINEVFDAILESEHGKPAFADKKRLEKADPDDADTTPPKIHPDVTHPRILTIYYDENICPSCGHVTPECACHEKKTSSLQVW